MLHMFQNKRNTKIHFQTRDMKKLTDEQKPGPGRPALPESERAITGSIRLTAARWEKLRRLGTAWLSRTIDRAKEPERE